MKVVFLGMNSYYTIVPLLAIKESHTVQGVIISRKGRKISAREKIKHILKKISGYRSAGPYSIEKTCEVYGIPYVEADSVNDAGVIEYIKSINPDVICMSGFNEKLSRDLISIPVYGIINAHSSVLPHFKGSNPFLQMIMQNRFAAGCSIHKVNEKFDDGPVLASSEISVYNGYNLAIYNLQVATKAAELFLEVLKKLPDGIQQKEIPNVSDSWQARNRKLLLNSEHTVAQLLWLYNAFSDSGRLKIMTAAGEKDCLKLSRKAFEGSSVMKAADGEVYIEAG